MRHLGLFLSLTACSIDNPQFGLKQETTGATSEQSTSGDPTTAPTTTASPSTSASTSTSEASTEPASATEPGTTTTGETLGATNSSGTTTAESTGGPACTVVAPDPSFSREVHDITADKDMQACGLMNLKITGLLKILDGQIVIHDAGSCANPGKGAALRLGDQLPLTIPDGELGCGVAKILWEPGCLMAAMLVTNAAETETLFVASFTATPPPLPILPEVVPAQICDCGGLPPGCCAPFPDPGTYALKVPPDPAIPEGGAGLISANGAPLLLHNLASRITNECIDGNVLGDGIYLAWIAEFAG